MDCIITCASYVQSFDSVIRNSIVDLLINYNISIIKPTICTYEVHVIQPLFYMFRRSTAKLMGQHQYLKSNKASYIFGNNMS
jgi:hypothetical protein